jgi:hypothetical protein
MSEILLISGGAIFALLGTFHAWYTYTDIAVPRRLVPMDPAVREAMMRTGLRLSGGATTMWRTWVGFNFSHSLGLVLYGGISIALGMHLHAWAPPRMVLLLPPAVGAIYFVLALRYWFRIPAAGAAVGMLCTLAAWLLYSL